MAVSSADPTPTWTTQTRVGYEFVADEVDVDGFVAGPLTDNLGIRFAGYRNQMKGWMLNNNYDSTPTPARRIPNEEDYGGRLTLRYADRDIGLDSKLKVALARVGSDMWSGDVGQHICLGAKAQNVGLPADNCVADNITQGEQYPNPYNPHVDWANSYGNTAAFATGDSSPLFTGRGYTSTETTFVALSTDYSLAPSLTLTSVSGYDKLTTKDVGRHSQLGILPPATEGGPSIPYSYTFDLAGVYQQEDYSQELRLASDWNDRWFNFMLGAFFTTGTAQNTTILDVPSATFINNFGTVLHNKLYSGFGQILLTPIEHWEFSAGVRYTDVKKHVSSLTYFPNTFSFYPPNTVVGQLAGVIPSEFTNYEQKNTSPEVTVTFRPADTITEFVSYKYGYKGPGLNVNAFTGTYVPGQVNFYGGEKVHGVEGGLKASLLDRHLSLTATAYDYRYSSLQVSFYNGEDFTTETSNGADAKVRGIEFGTNYNPTQITGLNVNGNINYNKADFSTFRGAPCFTGQTAEQGCVGIGPAAAQDLSGRQLPRAPRWTGDAGLQYQAHVSDKYSAALSGHLNFSSSYSLDSHYNPLAFEKSYVTFDAGLRFGKLDGPWEVALIGRNLSNKYVLSGGSDDGVAVPPNIADALVYVFRGRQIQLQLTMRPDIVF